jgi:hypothetical protein
VIAAALTLGIAVALGAIGDWYWWLPYNGILITLAAGALFLVAIVLALIPRTRPGALLAAIAGVGLIAGQLLGPSRPELQASEGTLTVTLTAPRPTTGTQAAYCSMDAGGTELMVSGDPNLRLDIVPDDPAAPADVDQREFFTVGLTVGDRWNEGPTPRADHIALSMIVGRVEADLPETRMASAPSSTIELTHSGTQGTLSFSGLVPVTARNEPAGPPIDIAGTLTWDCGEALE